LPGQRNGTAIVCLLETAFTGLPNTDVWSALFASHSPCPPSGLCSTNIWSLRSTSRKWAQPSIGCHNHDHPPRLLRPLWLQFRTQPFKELSSAQLWLAGFTTSWSRPARQAPSQTHGEQRRILNLIGPSLHLVHAQFALTNLFLKKPRFGAAQPNYKRRWQVGWNEKETKYQQD
jgi:hypothetical protein